VDGPDVEFQLMQDPLLRIQRMLRVIPHESFGTTRRILLLIAVTWVPIVVWAAMNGHLVMELSGETFLRHLGIHVRCLVAIPLLVLAEPLANRVMGPIVGNFVPSGVVCPDDRPAFDAVVRSIERLRNSYVAWIVIALIVVATAATRVSVADADEVLWGLSSSLSDFGVWWALYVVRPVFLFMLLAWLWRLALTWVLFRRIAKLELRLVPSHPDRVAGLAFLELHSAAFTPVVLAISSVVCANVAHQILAHGGRFAHFQAQLGSMVVLVTALFIWPLTAFLRPLWQVRMRGRFTYGALAGLHLRGLHERWIESRPVENEKVLDAPEIGPAADMATLYDLATRVRALPVGKTTIGSLIVPALIPVLFVASIEVPFKEILMKLVNALS
jgi:hypothetical protein